MKRMLINATQPEELRVALVDGKTLYDLNIEPTRSRQKKSNIYKGRIVRIEASLEAAFVEYGSEKHGFLPFREIAPELLPQTGNDTPAAVHEQLKAGQELIVQIEREERSAKGAALTTFISLAGRYLVLMPNNPRAGGVSRQISGEAREEARQSMSKLQMPQGMGVILRTAGVGKSSEELQWDLNYLMKLWNAIDEASGRRNAPFLIHQETDIISRAIRDFLRKDIDEIWVDDEQVHKQALEFMNQIMPEDLEMLKFHDGASPLFNRFHVESQIEAAYARKVLLPSGGALIIDHTEALISIDVNSAKSTGGSDVEETALHTNLEAAAEISCQMRLRDLAGLIVIDFIDMMKPRNQREVENFLREKLRVDRAMVQLGRISRFGLLEMSRQRLRPSLDESSHIPCPRCQGRGTIRDNESLALSVLRVLEEEANKNMTAQVVARLPIPVATFLLNEKRDALSEIEQRRGVGVSVVPCQDMEAPACNVERIRLDDTRLEQKPRPSYQMTIATTSSDTQNGNRQRRSPRQQPIVVQEAAHSRHEAAIVVHRPPHPAGGGNGTQGAAERKKGLLAKVLDYLTPSRPAMSSGSDLPASDSGPQAGGNGRGQRRATGRRRGRRGQRRGGNTPRKGPGEAAQEHRHSSRQTEQEERRRARNQAAQTGAERGARRRQGGNRGAGAKQEYRTRNNSLTPSRKNPDTGPNQPLGVQHTAQSSGKGQR